MKVGPQPDDPSAHARRQTHPPALRAGRVIEATVERHREATTLRLGGRTLTARVLGDVQVGVRYDFEVLRGGRRPLLRVVTPTRAPVDRRARASVLSAPEYRPLIDAFVRVGLPLQHERLALALRRVSSARGMPIEERARLAAVLEDKGLLDSPRVWQRLVAVLGGSEGEDRDHGRERGTSGRDRRDDTPPEPDDEAANLVPADEIRRAFRAAEAAEDPLQLANHRAGREEQWIVVPIAFSSDVPISASVRMRLPGRRELAAGASPRFREALIDVRTESARRVFSVSPDSEGLRVTLLGGAGLGDQVPWEELRKRLAAIGASFVAGTAALSAGTDAPPGGRDHDGFSTRPPAAILSAVDDRV